MDKFRYVVKHKQTGKLLIKIWTIGQIEIGELKDWINYDIRGYELHSREQSIIKDKNGLDIFENDICKDGDTEYQIVLMNDKTRYGAKVLECKSVLCRDCTFPLWQYIDDNGKCKIEVIGNIHEV